jgi:hypothetical protein
VAVSRLSSEEWIDGAWAEFNPKTALSGKEKELIGLAVASQVLLLLHYYQTEAAKLNGAIDAEVRDALNNMQADPAGFWREIGTVLRLALDEGGFDQVKGSSLLFRLDLKERTATEQNSRGERERWTKRN